MGIKDQIKAERFRLADEIQALQSSRDSLQTQLDAVNASLAAATVALNDFDADVLTLPPRLKP